MQKIYEELRDRIGLCLLSPGTRLNEERLAAEFGTSRTPVREALRLLEHAGLVTPAEPRGYAVREVDLTVVDQLYPIRIALEDLCLQLAAEAVGTPQFESFANDVATAHSQTRRLPTDFHERLVALADNPELTRILTDIHVRLYPLRKLDNATRIEEIDEDHRVVVDHLLHGDIPRARAHMRAHIERSHASVRALINAGVATISVGATRPTDGSDQALQTKPQATQKDKTP